MNAMVRVGGLCVAMWMTTLAASGQYFAAEVIDYAWGAAPAPPFGLTNPNAALGKPGPAVAGSPEFVFGPDIFPATPAEPLNPFAPHYDGSELVRIATGGHLTIRLERFVEIGAGLELGIFGNVGLANNDLSGDSTQRRASNTLLDPGQTFGIDDVVIEVSETGTPGSWVALNGGQRVTIQNPSSYYTDATGLLGPTEHTADLLPLLGSLTEADFGQPFAGGVTQFNDLSISEMETLLAGSAGGDWFDLSGLEVAGEPLSRVGYVRFSNPGATFELLAVSINTSLAGSVVPEPATWALLMIGGAAFGLRRMLGK